MLGTESGQDGTKNTDPRGDEDNQHSGTNIKLPMPTDPPKPSDSRYKKGEPSPTGTRNLPGTDRPDEART